MGRGPLSRLSLDQHESSRLPLPGRDFAIVNLIRARSAYALRPGSLGHVFVQLLMVP